MDKRLALVYGLISPQQVFEFYPPEGVPSAPATYSMWLGYRGDGEPAEFSGVATADTYSQPLSAASGYSQGNRRRVSVAITTGLVIGRRYRLENALGQAEVVRPAAISAGAYLEAEYDLAYDYPATTSTLKGYRQSFSPPDVFVQTEAKINAGDNPYRLRWDYVVGGVPRRYFQYVDLVRQDARDGVDDEDLKDAWPDIAYLVDPATRQRLLRQARATLDRDLRLRKVDPALVAQQPLKDQLLMDCFAMLAVRSGAAVPKGFTAPEVLPALTQAYLSGLESAITSLEQTNNRGAGDARISPTRGLGFNS